jgi:hypothetical protein
LTFDTWIWLTTLCIEMPSAASLPWSMSIWISSSRPPLTDAGGHALDGLELLLEALLGDVAQLHQPAAAVQRDAHDRIERRVEAQHDRISASAGRTMRSSRSRTSIDRTSMFESHSNSSVTSETPLRDTE